MEKMKTYIRAPQGAEIKRVPAGTLQSGASADDFWEDIRGAICGSYEGVALQLGCGADRAGAVDIICDAMAGIFGTLGCESVVPAPPVECRIDGDCPEGEMCVGGSCVPYEPPCDGDEDCDEWEHCAGGVCVMDEGRCETDQDCPEWEHCGEGNECVLDSGRCEVDGDCEGWESCSADLVCELNDGRCEADPDCSEGSVVERITTALWRAGGATGTQTALNTSTATSRRTRVGWTRGLASWTRTARPGSGAMWGCTTVF